MRSRKPSLPKDTSKDTAPYSYGKTPCGHTVWEKPHVAVTVRQPIFTPSPKNSLPLFQVLRHLHKFKEQDTQPSEIAQRRVVLMDQWPSCEGAWSESELYLQVNMKKKTWTFGSRRWMCKSEIEAKFGSATVAQQMIQAKTIDPKVAKSHVGANPDLHGQDSDCHQRLCTC